MTRLSRRQEHAQLPTQRQRSPPSPRPRPPQRQAEDAADRRQLPKQKRVRCTTYDKSRSIDRLKQCQKHPRESLVAQRRPPQKMPQHKQLWQPESARPQLPPSRPSQRRPRLPPRARSSTRPLPSVLMSSSAAKAHPANWVLVHQRRLSMSSARV